jgi:hypothetical protein
MLVDGDKVKPHSHSLGSIGEKGEDRLEKLDKASLPSMGDEVAGRVNVVDRDNVSLVTEPPLACHSHWLDKPARQKEISH